MAGSGSPLDMLKKLNDDNKALTVNMRELHGFTDEAGDCATTSQLEAWNDQSEERTWLFLATSDATQGGH